MAGFDRPVAEQSQKPLRTEHARLDSLAQEVDMKNRQEFFNQTIELT